MRDVISGFEDILASLGRKECRDEGVILLLDRMLKQDPARLRKVVEFFDTTLDDDLKEILASLIVKMSEESKYKKCLIEFHDWKEEDF
jgi:hypothetical protein